MLGGQPVGTLVQLLEDAVEVCRDRPQPLMMVRLALVGRDCEQRGLLAESRPSRHTANRSWLARRAVYDKTGTHPKEDEPWLSPQYDVPLPSPSSAGTRSRSCR